MAAKPSRVYLLDTNVILHLVRGKKLGKHLASTFGLMDPMYRPLVSIVSHGEIEVIADRNGWGLEKRKALETALNNLVTIDLNDQSIIEAYVDVSRTSRGTPGGVLVLFPTTISGSRQPRKRHRQSF